MMLLAIAFLVYKKGYNCLRSADISNLYDLLCTQCLKNLKNHSTSPQKIHNSAFKL